MIATVTATREVATRRFDFAGWESVTGAEESFRRWADQYHLDVVEIHAPTHIIVEWPSIAELRERAERAVAQLASRAEFEAHWAAKP